MVSDFMLTKVEIDSTDISSYIMGYKIEKTNGKAIHTVEIRMPITVNDTLTIESGDTVEIWRGWTTSTDQKIFDGYVEKTTIQGGLLILDCSDKMVELIRREVTYSYDEDIDASAGQISEIFKDLINTYTDLTADGTSVQDSPLTTGYTLKKFICNHITVMDACTQLAEALGWQFYYDADTNLVYFEPTGYTSYNTILYCGTDTTNYTRNIFNIPKWKIDKENLTNSLTVIGGEQKVVVSELFSGDGASQGPYQLTYTPVDIHVYYGNAKDYQSNAPVQSEEQVGGLDDTSTDPDYTVDKIKKQFTFTATGPTPTNNARNIMALYAYSVPTPILLEDQESIDTYDKHQRTIFLSDVTSTDDAEARANDYLTKWANPIYSTMIKTRQESTDLDVGKKVTIIDEVNIPNQNREMIITKYTIEYPNRYDTLEVGDVVTHTGELETEILKQIHKLQEKQYENQDILLHVINNYVEAYMRPTSFTVTANYLMDTYELGHPVNGVETGGVIENAFAGGTWEWSTNPTGGAVDNTYVRTGEGSSYMKEYTSSILFNAYLPATTDWSSYSGVNIGAPINGTFAFWLYCENGSTRINNIEIKFYYDNFLDVTKRVTGYAYEYRTRNITGYTTTDTTTNTFYDGWNYVLFDLDNPLHTVGENFDWRNVLDFLININCTSGSSQKIWIHYITISAGNYIGKVESGIGEVENIGSDVSWTYAGGGDGTHVITNNGRNWALSNFAGTVTDFVINGKAGTGSTGVATPAVETQTNLDTSLAVYAQDAGYPDDTGDYYYTCQLTANGQRYNDEDIEEFGFSQDSTNLCFSRHEFNGYLPTKRDTMSFVFNARYDLINSIGNMGTYALRSIIEGAFAGASEVVDSYTVYTDASTNNSIVSKTPTVINTCEVAGDWTQSADGTAPALNNVTYKEGTGAIDLGKNGVGGTTVTYYDDQVAQDVTSKLLHVWLYVKDSTTLAKIQTVANAGIFIRLSSDNGGANNYKQSSVAGRDTLSVGWNLIHHEADGGSETGAYDETNCRCWMIGFNTNNSADTITTGYLIMDYWHINDDVEDYALVAGYPTLDEPNTSLIARSYIAPSEFNGYPIPYIPCNLDTSGVAFGTEFTSISKSSTDAIGVKYILKLTK